MTKPLPTRRARARRASRARDRDHDVSRAGGRLGRPRPARDRLARARRHAVEPRGPAATPAAHGPAPVPGRARLDREARRTLRDRRARRTPRGLRRVSPARSEGSTVGVSTDARTARANAVRACPVAATPSAPVVPKPPATLSRRAAAASATGRCSRARSSSASPSSASSARRPSWSSPPKTPARRTIATGDTVIVRSNGTSVELRARVNRKLVDGVARVAEEHAADLHPTVEVVKR